MRFFIGQYGLNQVCKITITNPVGVYQGLLVEANSFKFHLLIRQQKLLHRPAQSCWQQIASVGGHTENNQVLHQALCMPQFLNDFALKLFRQ
ncbi:hypothetical protein MCEMIEM28_01756 [Burkholderiaceae bacterium]